MHHNWGGRSRGPRKSKVGIAIEKKVVRKSPVVRSLLREREGGISRISVHP